MPRKPRFNLPGLPQYVIQRGNNREPCFLTTQDYHQYLDDLGESVEKYGCRLHAYALMTNCVHLLITPMSCNGVSKMMQAIGRRYVYYFNKTYHRSGTLWEGRYRSSLIDSDRYLLTCMRYIESAPVRAKLVKHPNQYFWSSYMTNAEGAMSDLIKPDPMYLSLAASDKTRLQRYRMSFQQPINDDLLKEIRDSVNQELVLGRANFKDKVEEMTKRQTRKGIRGRPRIEEEPVLYYVW